MKKILIHFLACITVFVFWLNQDATPHDKLLIRNKWKSVFKETKWTWIDPTTGRTPDAKWQIMSESEGVEQPPSVIWNEYIHSLKR